MSGNTVVTFYSIVPVQRKYIAIMSSGLWTFLLLLLLDCKGFPTSAKIPHLRIHKPNPLKVGTALGTIQVLRHQRGGWVGSENGNF